MKIWIAGTVKEVAKAMQTGLVSAIVTNPAVVAEWTKNSGTLEDVIKEVTDTSLCPLYIQLHGPTEQRYLKEAEYLKRISDRVTPKLPATLDGLMAARKLEDNGIETLITTVVSINQAYACAAAGVTTICPYYNRLKESGEDAVKFLTSVTGIYQREEVRTRVMPASIRTTADIENALLAGCSGVIIFYPLFMKMFEHAVSESSLKLFENDWNTIPYALK